MSDVLEKPVSFPATYDEVVAINNALVTESQNLEKEISARKQRVDSLKAIQGITYALLTSWRERYAGKYCLHVSFVDRSYIPNRVVAKEFLPLRVKRPSKEEWDSSAATQQDALSPYWKVIPFAEVARHACPTCGEDHPVLEWYRQTHDSPSFDQWLKRYLLVCTADMSNLQVIELSREVS